jgi:hypothetical protein
LWAGSGPVYRRAAGGPDVAYCEGATIPNQPRRSPLERLRRFLLAEYWNIGVVDQTTEDIAARGIAGPVRWLATPSHGTMLADPHCLVRPDGRRTLFAEYLDYRAPRGELWSADLAPGQDLAGAVFRPFLSTGFHMSYPQTFGADGEVFLICESWEAQGIPLWRDTGGGWEPLPPILAGRQVVDPTLFKWQGRWWLFCTFQDDEPDGRLHLFHAANPRGPWTPHPANPVQADPGCARPAGPIFMKGDVPVRPAQDCSRTYGGAVVLQEILELTADSYRERALRRLEPSSPSYPHGLHTLAPAGEVSLVDGKRWGREPVSLAEMVAAKSAKIANRTFRRLPAAKPGA